MPSLETELPERNLPALRRSDERDPTLDAMCRTAAALFGVRYAFVSHLDTECQLFLGRVGLDVQTTSRSIAFCALTVLGAPHEPLVVLDTHRDRRFAQNPLVTGAPYLRFYAGVPIVHADGSNTATFCIADDAPRKAFSEADRHCLLDLAKFIEATLYGRAAQIEAERAREQADAAYAALRESEHRYRLLAENANDVIVLGDLDMRRLYISPAVRTVLGYEPEELVGTTPAMFGHPEEAHAFADLRAKLLMENDGRFVACVRHRHKAGHYVWIEASVRLARDPHTGHPVGYVAALRDVTARRAAEEQVRHMALHDALTGLPNRTLLRDRLDQAIARAAHADNPFAVLICDLDRFKAINDSFGHPAGDVLLQAVAARMKVVLRPCDTIARLGGDEFAIILTYLDDPCAAACLADNLIATVSKPIDLDGHGVEVGVSIGFTIASAQDASADDLFNRADIALYEAKAAGRNTYREFCPDAGARITIRGHLGLDMKEAIRRGEFRLVYQPVVEAATGAVMSFEALMRWRHPERGEISPGEFIPVAEETGLIVPLGTWALQEACREAMNWPTHIRIGVNVSPIQLRQDGLETAVLAALAASGLPSDRLKLEVTESVLIQDADEVLERLHRLRALGVRIALDDFGTGYSSLSYLRRFPFDKIKIDRAFIKDIADADAAAIVRAVVGIGERLGMGIVAEGVETVEQLELVRSEGCGEVQGFLFSRPLPAREALLYAKKECVRAA
ncbi:putative bifunctional diguanylate cyclase/phosphodiesterase [Methylobacterium sp. J-070]|uniref:putative bifunctional diguanylate cyclase/phosphodiesterase n=1 Tax=Methylobacterium sp. J-070 TaxID=2836650 RepID=UPI001FBA15AE|nr:EAL domain-containing protein [Methylobacterium sp. J-070]MCJ2048495.1 EAL domain-containing protein [Methylobacterium sp. J-070]